jgi:hypothetical protein
VELAEQRQVNGRIEMVGLNANYHPKIVEFRAALYELPFLKDSAAVALIEDFDPPHDSRVDDYKVIYEIVFYPRDFEHALLQVNLFEDGQIGILFERRSRMAKRLGLPLKWQPNACCAGIEMAQITTDELIRLVQLVALGKVLIQASLGIYGLGTKLLGLGACRAFVLNRDLGPKMSQTNRIFSLGSFSTLNDFPEDTFGQKIVYFKPWP